MIESRPSLTAERVAVLRAAHRLLDDPCVYEDPLAFAILGEARAAALRADPRSLADGPIARRVRALVVIRSRLAEEALGRAVASGVRQCVVLGAGLDTFAYRNPYPDLRVFEVDHPVTQTWKRGRLADSRITVPESLTFVAANLGDEPLSVTLPAAGLNIREPSFFSCLGLTPYLESRVVLSLLESIAPLAKHGGGVVFDYIVPPELMGGRRAAGFAALATRVAAAGEPFLGHFEPGPLAAALSAMGFIQVSDLGADDLNAAFFSGRADGLEVGSAGRILTAFG